VVECQSDAACDSALNPKDRLGPCAKAVCVDGTCREDAHDESHVCRKPVVAGDGTSCDVEDKCDGTSYDCPADEVKSKESECRPAKGDCDKVRNGLAVACCF
jgi:hypothetical protein